MELESGSFRIGTSTTVLMFFVPRVLRRFRRQYPKVSVHLSTSTVKDIFANVASGNLDLGLVFSPPELREPRTQVTQEPLYEEEFVLAVSAGHPLASRKSLAPADLADVDLITYSRHSTLRQYLEVRLRSAALSRES